MKDISIQELKNTAVQMRMKVIDMIYSPAIRAALFPPQILLPPAISST